MRILTRLTLLTLVPFFQLCSAFSGAAARAAVGDPSPDFRDASGAASGPAASEQGPSKADDLQKRQTIDIKSPPPAPRKAPAVMAAPIDGFFFPYHSGLTFEIGEAYAKQSRTADTDAKPLNSLFGIQYVFPTAEFEAYEFGGFVLTDTTARLHFSRRFNFSQERWRPYCAIGFGLALFSADGFASFVQFRNYQLRGATGFEYSPGTLNHVLNLRVELAAAFGLNAQDVSAAVGQVWSW